MSLAAVSLIEYDAVTDSGAFVSVHRLVQAAMRQRLIEQRAWRATAKRVTRQLAQSFPHSIHKQPELEDRCAALLPHVISLREHTLQNGKGMTRAMARLLDAAGVYLSRQHGSYWPSRIRSQPTPVTGTLYDLALSLMAAGRHIEAESLLRDLLAIGERGNDPRLMFGAHGYLGKLMLLTERYSAAETHFREAMAYHGREGIVPWFGIGFISLHHYLAVALHRMGRNEEALTHVMTALSSLRKDRVADFEAAGIGPFTLPFTLGDLIDPDERAAMVRMAVDILEALGRTEEARATRDQYGLG
jgi:tetratricopeptide (TPR) repeat protein